MVVKRRLHRGGEGNSNEVDDMDADGPEVEHRMHVRRREAAQVDELSVTIRTESSPEALSKKRRA
jgi:hypothetical protein